MYARSCSIENRLSSGIGFALIKAVDRSRMVGRPYAGAAHIQRHFGRVKKHVKQLLTHGRRKVVK